MVFALTATLALSLLPATAGACWDEAAGHYGLSSELLIAIARVESTLQPQAVTPGCKTTRWMS
jgi:soluble lytic murein transglycosylase-like protein